MIHYHGTPFGGAAGDAADALMGRHAFVSYARMDQLQIVIEVCQSYAFDNGAFSAWKSGKPITDWREFYSIVGDLNRVPGFDFAVIPDVIDGDEAANDALLDEWPFPKWVGAPVWHLHESLDRLRRLALEWPRVCIGSSGAFATIGTADWWQRMAEAMSVVTDKDGRPITKLHGLRMLDSDVFTKFPFHSADSTNVARNITIDGRWNGTYAPPTKSWRAKVIMARIEAYQSALFWETKTVPTQGSLL